MKPFAACRLYTFIDTAYLGTRAPDAVAKELCDGGADLIQIRAKHATADEVLHLAEVVLPIANAAGTGVIINDHPEVAIRAGAMACHLGQEDFFGAGRTRAAEVTGPPPGTGLGLSTHSPEQAIQAIAAGPDYIAVGPVYPTPTKPGVPAVTLDYVKWAARHVRLPWFAIGGITLANLEEVLDAGATRICVVSAILRAPDVARACQAFKDRLVSRPV
jgi:thiamine-phosphate pyrophosphorylase